MNKTNITNITNITLYPHQLKCIEAIELNKEPKCLINQWCGTQQTNYKTKKNIMSNNDIRKSWENFIKDDKYKEYFK